MKDDIIMGNIMLITCVVPVFNEEESVLMFFNELTKELDKLKKTYEIIFVDDGSTDTSLSLLKKIAKGNSQVHVYSFRKNQGKAEALTLGFQKAKGQSIVTLDADLQDQPKEIRKLLEKQGEGIDVVCGWRKDRRDTSRMVFISKVFNYVLGKLFGLSMHDYNCGLKVYTTEAAKSLRLYGGMHRFIPLLAYEQGFSVEEVVVEHQIRKFGKSKYTFSKIKDLPDIFTMLFLAKYSKRPLHFFGIVGGSMFLLGFLIFDYLTFIHFAFNQTIGRRPLFFTSIFLLIAGLQVFFTGFIAELIISLSNRTLVHFPLKYSTDES